MVFAYANISPILSNVMLNELDKETLNAIKEMPAKIAESFEKAEFFILIVKLQKQLMIPHR